MSLHNDQLVAQLRQQLIDVHKSVATAKREFVGSQQLKSVLEKYKQTLNVKLGKRSVKFEKLETQVGRLRLKYGGRESIKTEDKSHDELMDMENDAITSRALEGRPLLVSEMVPKSKPIEESVLQPLLPESYVSRSLPIQSKVSRTSVIQSQVSKEQINLPRSLSPPQQMPPLPKVFNKSKMFKCDHCVFETFKVSHFNNHIKNHPNYRPFTCDVTGCVKRFRRSDHRDEHQRNHRANVRYDCKMPGCWRSFTSRHGLNSHYSSCHPCESFLRVEQVVKNKIASPMDDNLPLALEMPSSSLKGVHPDMNDQDVEDMTDMPVESPPTPSTNGNSSTSTDKNYTGPVVKYVNNKNRYFCDLCDFVGIKSEFNWHVRSHPGYTPFVCTVCHKSFRRDDYLSEHFRGHLGDMKYVCKKDGCKAAFNHISSFKNHTRLVHSATPEPHVCTIENCSSSFSLKADLINHQQLVHNYGMHFECVKCPKMFTSQQDLLNHSDACHLQAVEFY